MEQNKEIYYNNIISQLSFLVEQVTNCPCDNIVIASSTITKKVFLGKIKLENVFLSDDFVNDITYLNGKEYIIDESIPFGVVGLFRKGTNQLLACIRVCG